MRGLLRSFLNWLDKRFPEKVVITQVEYVKMRSQMQAIEKIIARIESDVNVLKGPMGMGSPLGKATGPVGGWQR